MITYFFQGGSEYLQIRIVTREEILIANSKSGFKLVDKTKEFYDNEEEKKKCLDMSEDEYQDYLDKQLKKLEGLGYKLKKITKWDSKN